MVPDLAIVPNEDFKSSSFMPTPLSEMVMHLSLLFISIFISKGDEVSFIFLSVILKYFFLSIASDALEMSSRIKISLSEYRELITISKIFPVSASN